MTAPARDPLSPFFPHGALRLLYWVFFAPSRLRVHVRAIAPEYADAKGLRPLLAALRASPPLRRFLSRALAFTLIAPLVIDIATALVVVSLGENVSWFGLALGMAVGAAWGVAMGVFVVVVDMARGVASGVAGGVSIGVALGVAGGVALGVAGGVAGGVVFGMVLGMVLGMAFGVTLGVAGGVAVAVGAGMVGAVGVGAVGAVVLGVAGGVVGAVGAVGVGVVVLGVAGGVAGLRLPFYLFQFPWALRMARRRDALNAWRRSPAHWDELLVLPQPGLAGLLQKALAQDLAAGLQAVAIVASNPFQRWAAGRALAGFLQDYPDQFFLTLDHLLRQPMPYRAVGNNRDEQERATDHHFTTQLLLAELAGLPPIPDTSDGLARAFTAPWRRAAPRPLRNLAGAYHAWLTVQEPSMDRLRALIASTLDALGNYRDYPHGEDVYASFRTWERFLGYETLKDLSQAPSETAWLDERIAPLHTDAQDILNNLNQAIDSLEVLRTLEQVGREVENALATSSHRTQLEALTRADLLINQTVRVMQLRPSSHTPAFTILLRWSDIIAAGRERLSRSQIIIEISNNYIFGSPLKPEHGRLFVGRHDTFEEIRRLWSNRLRKQSLVIHGQRRVGKSSILYHLQERLSGEQETYLTVYADLQGLASVSDVNTLLYNLADVVAAQLDLPRPALDDFYPAPFVAWRQLLDRVDACLDERQVWLVLMLDEFETVEAKLKDEVFPQDLLHNLRSTIQHRPRLTLVFAGCHTLEQMTRDYWGPFFGTAVNFKVESLDHAAAQELITNPWDDFRLNYERPAIERIIQVSGGQPYLLQAVCYQVIEEMNRQLAESGPQFSPRVALADVEGVLDRVLTAGYYFEAVWDELNEAEQLLLSALGQAADEDGRGERAQIERLLAGQLTAEALQNAWNSLAARDMLAQEGEQARFVVELVYRWVRSRKPLNL